MRITTSILTSIFTFSVLVACGGKGTTEDDTTQDTTPEDTTTDTSVDVPSEDGGCTSDSDCDDGVFCNGVETCNSSGECEEATTVECDDGDPCTEDSCDEDAGECDHATIDDVIPRDREERSVQG